MFDPLLEYISDMEVDLLDPNLWLVASAILIGFLAFVSNLPTSIWMSARPATLEYLAEAPLKYLTSGDDEPTTFKEADKLSSLKAELDRRGMKLVAVVIAPAGVRGFRDYFDGEVYVDVERRFYGPKHRWMFLSGFVRPSSFFSVIRAYRKGYKGDMKGEGRLLGGCFVMGPGQQGILQEQRQRDWGDQINAAEVHSSLDKVFGPPRWVQQEEKQHALQKKMDNEMRQRQQEYEEQENLSEIAPLPTKKELLREIPGRRRISAADANGKML